MSPTAIALVLAAALAHASWNLMSKQASAAGAACFVWLMSAAGLILFAPVVGIDVTVTHPRMAVLGWAFMAGTGLLHAGYFLLLQNGYRLGDLSVVYPTGRGTGAVLAAAGGIVLLGERPSAVGAAGIALVVAGIVAIGLPGADPRPSDPDAAADPPRAPHPNTAGPCDTNGPRSATTDQSATPGSGPAVSGRALGAVAFALLTGVFIGAYTLWDKVAVSRFGVPPVAEVYASLVGESLLLAPFALRDRRRLATLWRRYRGQVLGAATLSPLSYILVLTALRFTAVSAVAPAREVSVLFGVLLGRRLLGEGSLPRRLTAAAAIAAGIIAIAVG